MDLWMGIDISTTGVKVLVIDSQGEVVGKAITPLTLSTPKPLWSEQDPTQWWQAAVKSVRQLIANNTVDAKAIKGVALTGQMHSLVLLNEKGDVLRKAILWNDQRTGEQCALLRARLGKKKLIQITGNDATTGFTAPKILWVQQHEPEIWKMTRHILLPKDYIRFKLTGEFASDRAGASGTLLFDLSKRNWSSYVLAALDIPVAYLPITYEGIQVTGTLLPSVATEIGLPSGIPVFGGGGDQAASAVGTGAVRAGVVSLSLGTSGVIFATTNKPTIEVEGRLHAFCHCVPGKWHLMSVMLSAGGSLRWHRDTFAPNMDYDKLLDSAADVHPGSNGLFFLPYLTGERSPHSDPLARSAYVGLTIRHSFPHLTRAVLEGVSFGLRDSIELMKNSDLTKISQIRITGGGSRSALWRQILADVLNSEIVTVNTVEGAAYGAALLAATGSGVFRSVESACDATIHLTSTTSPGNDQGVYERIYPLYRDIYPALKPLFMASED